MSEPLRLSGIGRDCDSPKWISLIFSRRLTDEELVRLHDAVRLITPELTHE